MALLIPAFNIDGRSLQYPTIGFLKWNPAAPNKSRTSCLNILPVISLHESLIYNTAHSVLHCEDLHCEDLHCEEMQCTVSHIGKHRVEDTKSLHLHEGKFCSFVVVFKEFSLRYPESDYSFTKNIELNVEMFFFFFCNWKVQLRNYINGLISQLGN